MSIPAPLRALVRRRRLRQQSLRLHPRLRRRRRNLLQRLADHRPEIRIVADRANPPINPAFTACRETWVLLRIEPEPLELVVVVTGDVPFWTIGMLIIAMLLPSAFVAEGKSATSLALSCSLISLWTAT